MEDQLFKEKNIDEIVLERENTSQVNNPLFLKGWVDFNIAKWNVKPVHLILELENKSLPRIEGILYQDNRGRINKPPLNPYLALTFQSTNTTHSYRSTSQWLQLAEILIKEMRSYGLNGPVFLPPDIKDVRPFQWAGFTTNIRYTYRVSFPYDLNRASNNVRGRIKKATNMGYKCIKSINLDHICECLHATEERQKFHHQLTKEDLEVALSFLGHQNLIGYICYSPDGEPASAAYVLYTSGGDGIGWLLGTKFNHFKYGASQLLYSYIFEDLQTMGATGFDLHGANFKTIATSKANWGFDLIPYYVIEEPGLKSTLYSLANWWKFLKKSM